MPAAGPLIAAFYNCRPLKFPRRVLCVHGSLPGTAASGRLITTRSPVQSLVGKWDMIKKRIHFGKYTLKIETARSCEFKR